MAEKEYIEREKAIEYLTLNMGWHDEDGYPVDDWDERKAHVADLINGIPAADVRPVVLCRDCIHYKPQQKSARWSSTTPMCSRSATIKMPPDGFCSFGVKREES